MSEDGIAESHSIEAARDGEYDGEGHRVRSYGSFSWAYVTLTALRNAEGELVSFAKGDARLLGATRGRGDAPTGTACHSRRPTAARGGKAGQAHGGDAQATSRPVTIAVLPLENRSNDPSTEYFADGRQIMAAFPSRNRQRHSGPTSCLPRENRRGVEGLVSAEVRVHLRLLLGIGEATRLSIGAGRNDPRRAIEQAEYLLPRIVHGGPSYRVRFARPQARPLHSGCPEIRMASSRAVFISYSRKDGLPFARQLSDDFVPRRPSAVAMKSNSPRAPEKAGRRS